MNNAEKFKQIFGLYATELWSMPEGDFLAWLNRAAETAQNVSDSDLISRKAAIEAIAKQMPRSYTPDGSHPADEEIFKVQEIYADCIESIEILPAAQPETNCSEIPNSSTDCIGRQVAIDALGEGAMVNYQASGHGNGLIKAIDVIKGLPSARPERTCVNCGRTVNNGGWHADGRTRCPIEEHYALPKDGYCHLWEKRNVTDDDYPERREE